MRMTVERIGDDVRVQLEREPMPPERFNALCRLGGLTIGGVVLLGAIRMVGFWAIPWAVGALAAVGLYKIGQFI